MAGDWRDYAACLGMDLAVFFPENRGPGTSDQALEVCATCPVTVECLAYAGSEDPLLGGRNADWGVWGGTTGSGRELTRLANSRKKQRNMVTQTGNNR